MKEYIEELNETKDEVERTMAKEDMQILFEKDHPN